MDYIGQGLTDYLKVVKRPMDLSQLRRNMELGEYEFLYEFLHDADLIWSNCRTYTKDSPVFNEICNYMEETFMLQLDKLEPRISNEVHKLITTQNIPHQKPETRIFSATRLQCLIKELLDLPEQMISECVYALLQSKNELNLIHGQDISLKLHNCTYN